MKTRLIALAATLVAMLALVVGFITVPANAAVACTTGNLSASLGSTQSAAGSRFQVIRLTNTSGHACSVYGFPGISLTRANHAQIGLSAKRDFTLARHTVTLAPGQTARATLQIVNALNYPKSVCHPVTSTFLRVIPPNRVNSRFVPLKVNACSKPVQTLFIRALH
jgi:hypothetical protein